MRIDNYLLVLAPLVLIGCVAEPTTVTTTTTTREVTTTGPGGREVLVTQAPPAVRVETQPASPGRHMSGHLGTGVGRAPVTYGCRAVGSCRRGKPLFGCRVTGCVGREVGCGSRGTGSKASLTYVFPSSWGLQRIRQHRTAPRIAPACTCVREGERRLGSLITPKGSFMLISEQRFESPS